MTSSPFEFTRRAFLQSALAVGSAAVIAREWLGPDDLGAGAPLTASDRILVVVELNGGLDGLNTLVPYSNPIYYAKRRGLAVAAERVLAIDGEHGLNPNLAYVKERYDSGDVAIVRGAGQVDNDRSHFSGMARVMGATAGSAPATTGWLGRYLDGSALDGYGAVSIGTNNIPLLLRGQRSDAILLPLETSGLMGADRTRTNDRISIGTIASYGRNTTGLGPTGDRLARRFSSAIDAAAALNPMYQPQLGTGRPLVAALTLAARVINLDLGTRIVHVYRIGFDTHSGQPGVDDDLLRELDDGLSWFFGTLLPQFHSRTAIVTLTEFGRRVEANGALGTDHGTASVCFLIGQRVKGGLHGVSPSLADLDSRGDLRVHVDGRAIAATVLDDWLRADARQILGASYSPLELFEREPACGPNQPARLAPSDRYVSIAPVRILDTRVGLGAPKARIGAGATLNASVLGRGTVPASGVHSVVINMTATDATDPTFLTVWPAGEARPTVSNLNAVPGLAVPNLVLAKVGRDGAVSIYNSTGAVSVIGDVVGWFPSSNPFAPLSPARILDTRRGLGAPARKLGPANALRLQVAGQGGVPRDRASAAVLNVTATDGDRPSFITAWPADESKPYVSNLNVRPTRSIPNLVVAKLSPDGAVNLYNDDGNVHVIADVFGWFPDGGGFTALTPQRILDTRTGTGARGKLRAKHVLDVDALCRGGVPASASAIVINVTVAEPATAGYLTVWPSGNPVPGTSNLNFAAGDVVPNLVFTKIGVSGMVSFMTPQGDCHVIADVMGWFE